MKLQMCLKYFVFEWSCTNEQIYWKDLFGFLTSQNMFHAAEKYNCETPRMDAQINAHTEMSNNTKTQVNRCNQHLA